MYGHQGYEHICLRQPEEHKGCVHDQLFVNIEHCEGGSFPGTG